MSLYKCPRCWYETSNKSNLYRHLRSTKPCLPLHSDTPNQDILDEMKQKNMNGKFKCSECAKSYNSRQGLAWHRDKEHKRCTDMPLEAMNDFNALKKRVAALERQLAEKQHFTQVNIQQNIQTQNNIKHQQNIIINAFGKEDVQYITQDPKTLLYCLKKRHEGICDYITLKHFNESHPENHNIRKLNKKGNMIEYHDGKKWRMNFKNQVINLIMLNIENDVKAFIADKFSSENNMGKEAHKILDSYMESIGKSFDWDLNCDNYEYEDILDIDGLSEQERNIIQKQRDEFQKQMYEMAIEHIYNESKKVHI